MSPRASMSRGTRWAYVLRVALAGGLAVAVAVLVMEAADWTFWRVDLSAAGRNTVDPATVERLANLDQEVEVDTFFRPLAYPFTAVSSEALRTVREYLVGVESAQRDRVRLVHNDLSDLAAVRERQRELGVEGENLFVVRYRGRKAVVRVFGEAATVDWGNPPRDQAMYLAERGIPNVVNPRALDRRQRPAQLLDVPVEQAFAEAVARVSIEEPAVVVFSTGHGELPMDGTEVASLRALVRLLTLDGFECRPWDPVRDGGVPEDAELLVMAGPSRPLRPEHLAYVRSYVDGGGRLLAAVADDPELARQAGSLESLLASYGLVRAPGVVCEEITDASGQMYEGFPECSYLVVDGQGFNPVHPVTELMRRRNRRVIFSYSGSFDAGKAPEGGQVLELVSSTREAWRDLPHDDTGLHDFALQQSAGERKGRRALAALSQFRAAAGPVPMESPAQARVLALGTAAFLADSFHLENRDFLRAAINWMTERDQRVDVAPRSYEPGRIDVLRGGEMKLLSRILWLALPGLCVVVGGLVGWRRRR